MPLIEDDNWTVGPARVRASCPDPLEGLRGHDYIAARGLNKQVQRLGGDEPALLGRLTEPMQPREAKLLLVTNPNRKSRVAKAFGIRRRA